jgi:hypothetical protein
MNEPKQIDEKTGPRLLGAIAVLLFFAVMLFALSCLTNKSSLAEVKESLAGLVVTVPSHKPAEAQPARRAAPTRPKRLSGDFLSDLWTALEEGETSGLVELEKEGDLALLDRLKSAVKTDGEVQGMSLFRLAKQKDGAETYEICLNGTDVRGLITMKNVMDRWHVVGVGVAPQTNSEAEDEQSRKLLEYFRTQQR